MTTRRVSAWALVLAIAAARMTACGGSATCGGAPLPGGLPASEERVGAADVRLTSDGLTWLGQNAPTLLQLFLPGGLAFTLSESRQLGGTLVICPTSQRPMGCPFTLSVNELKLAPTPPSTLTANLWIDIPKQDIPVHTSLGDCALSVEAARTPVVIDLALSADATTRALAIAPTVRPLSGEHLTLTGTGLCAVAGLAQSFLLPFIQGQLQQRLGESLDDRLCIKCDGGCPTQTTCGARSLCRHGAATDARCVSARQGLAGQYDVSAVLGALAREHFATIRYGFTLGGSASADTGGVNLGLVGGAGAEPSTCVPATAARARNELPLPTLPATAPNGHAYHVGAAISGAAVEDLVAAAWRSGALCLRATSRTITQLTSDAFALVLPALGKLTEGKSRPVVMDIRLDESPRVRVGSGRTHVDARGQTVLDEPLLALTLPSMVLDLYTLIEDRWTRVGSVKQDVTVPLGMDPTPDGRAVSFLLGDLAHAASNVRVLDAEILGATAPSLGQAVPALLSLALPIALGSLRPIEIPSFSGFGLTIRGVGGVPASSPTHAVIFADLRTTADLPPGAMRGVARTEASATRVEPGRVELALGGRAPDGGPLEWSWRLGDSTLWSPFTTSSAVVLDDPRLTFLGDVTLEVRARAVGRPETLDPTPARLVLQIDAPSATPLPEPAPLRGCASLDESTPAIGLLLLVLLFSLHRMGRSKKPRKA